MVRRGVSGKEALPVLHCTRLNCRQLASKRCANGSAPRSWQSDCLMPMRGTRIGRRTAAQRRMVLTPSKGTLLKAVLLGTMALPMLTIPALAQQEVDPTWYDPWAAAPKAAAQSTQATETKQQHKMSTATAAAARPKTKKQIQAMAQTKNSGRSERTQAMATAPELR